MEEAAEKVRLEDVQSVISEMGYEVELQSPALLKIRDVDSGIVIRSVLEENILFNTVSCLTIPAKDVTADLMRKMLAAGNGISTSNFQIYDAANGKVAVTLNNFCKLQSMQHDDRDDILSCLEFLVVDVCAARELLGELA